jgi:hypothetical protein
LEEPSASYLWDGRDPCSEDGCSTLLCLAVSCFSEMDITVDLCSFSVSVIICFVQILFFSILCPVQLMAMWFKYRTMNVCYLKHISVGLIKCKKKRRYIVIPLLLINSSTVRVCVS